MRRYLRLSLFLFSFSFFAACDSDTDPKNDGNDRTPLPLVGDWESPYGTETISETTWESFDTEGTAMFSRDITWVDLAAESLVLKNGPDAEYSPNTFSRLLWTQLTDNAFSYCEFTFGHETEEAAVNESPEGIDAEDLESGCGGFPWTTLTRQ